jgi:hypothetical protein
MNKLFRSLGSPSIALLSLLVCASFVMVRPAAFAAELQSARITQIIKDVRLLPGQAAPRPAAVSDDVKSGTAVRTGAESRAELTFTDLTITRLGENTVFSFNEGTRNLTLGSGAILVQVPPKAPPVQISSAAFTCAITGGTAIAEYNKGSPSKVLILEGGGHFCSSSGECVDIPAGEMVTLTPDGHLSKPVKFNAALVYQTSHLITDFPELANAALIFQVIDQQQSESSGGPTNPQNTNNTFDATTVRAAASPTPASSPSPTPPGIPVITAPNPYVINNGTTIVTHPTITTNGVTNQGVIYRGSALDGPVSAFAFGSTSAFDIASGFDEQVQGNNAAAGFKFTSLQLAGNPTIDTTNGPVDLGLIAIDGITSSAPGGTLTFAGIRGLLLAAQNGSVNLGPEISFSGLHDLNIYARGASSDLTLGSDINTTSKVRLFAERDMFTSSTITTEDLFAVAGRDMQISGSDTLQAVTISLTAFHDLTWSGETSDETATNSEGSVFISANNNINIANDLSFTRRNGGQTSGLNLEVSAGGDLAVQGGLGLTADNSMGGSLDSGANITVHAGGNLTVNGEGGLSLNIANNDGGHIGTGGNVSVTTGGDLTAHSLLAQIDNSHSGIIGNVDIGGNITLNVGGDLTINNGGDLILTIANNDGGHIGTGGNISVDTVSSVSTRGFTLLVTNYGDVFGSPGTSTGSIGTGGNISVMTGGNLATDFASAFIDNRNGGSIGSDATISFNVSGAFTTQEDAPEGVVGPGTQESLTLLISNRPDTAATSGVIGGNATISLTAASVSVGGILDAFISNRPGTIDGSALIHFQVSGDLISTEFTEFEIDNADDLSPPSGAGGTINSNATINVSAGNISTTGGSLDFFISNRGSSTLGTAGGMIGGDAAINVNSGDISTDTADEFLVEIANQKGTIGGDAKMDVTAANISAGDIFAFINNRNTTSSGTGGTIQGKAEINFNVSAITTAGDDLSAFGDATFLISNDSVVGGLGGSIGTDAKIEVSAGSISSAGDFFTRIFNSRGGSIGGQAIIQIGTTGNISANSLQTQIDNSNGGTIGSSASVALNASGDVATTSGDIFSTVSNQSGTIGTDAGVGLQARDVTSAGAIVEVLSNDGGTIGGGAGVNVGARNVTTGATDLNIAISNTSGTIGGPASVTFNATGDVNATGNTFFQILNNPTTDGAPLASIGNDATVDVSGANISTTNQLYVAIDNTAGTISGDAAVIFTASSNISAANSFFQILNGTNTSGSGFINGNASVDLTAANLSVTSLQTEIDNSNGGVINGNATIDMNVSGDATVTNNATVQILGSSGAASAAINFNGGNYDVGVGTGGTFLSTIDGDGAITFANANVHADVLKVGVFGTNGTLTIGGGSLSGDTELKLYAPGSNGSIDFVANVTLTSPSTAAIIAANKVTIENSVTVTIGGTIPASVYTNIPNYSVSSGGNGTTTGTFGGAGATTSSLSGATPFDVPAISSSTATAGGNTVKAASAAINVGNSAQLLSLLDTAVPGPGGKIRIPASNSASNSGKSNRINPDGGVRADRGAPDIRRPGAPGATNSTFNGAGAKNPQPLSNAAPLGPPGA